VLFQRRFEMDVKGRTIFILRTNGQNTAWVSRLFELGWPARSMTNVEDFDIVLADAVEHFVWIPADEQHADVSDIGRSSAKGLA